MGRPIQYQRLDMGIAEQPARRGVYAARKVPEVIALFWVVKLLTTGMGETTSDYLVFHVNKYAAVAGCGVLLVIALTLQIFVVKRYIAWVYWLAALMVAIFGTMAADVVHIVMGVPYLDSSVFFFGALAVIFMAWYATERTLSIHSITTLRRELFYWATVMATFALGTATGDMTASTLKLGYLHSGFLFAALFALPGIGYFLFRLNPIFAFWFAYIMTRPFGASFADWFGKPKDLSGLGWGTGLISIVLAAVIAVLVGYLAISRRDVQK
ncbi:MAG TPA: hypothetical protein VJN88_10610 [Ktedonobacterales bacterium]|nr:hypothetical protein [Ktedonobacterales bacterium]